MGSLVSNLFISFFSSYETGSVDGNSSSVSLSTSSNFGIVVDNAQRPNISLGGINLSPEDFRRHVNWRAQHSFSHVGLFQAFTKSKISQLDNAIAEKDIIRLQIPVHDVVLVENLEGLKKLLKDEQGLFFWKHTLLF